MKLDKLWLLFFAAQISFATAVSAQNIPPNSPAIAQEVTVTVRKIEILGSTVFSEQELQQEVASFLGKLSTTQDLLAIRAAITDLYTRNGYLTSGAFLPVQNQDFTKGIVRVQVVEGELERIDIVGLSRLQEDYARSRLTQVGSRPVNIRSLESSLQLLQINPLFSSVKAELKAGSSVGRNVLTVQLTEANPWIGSLTLANIESPSVGDTGLYGTVATRNLTGFGDLLRIDLGGTEGTRRYGVRYELPITDQSDLLLRYDWDSSRIIEPPFSSIGINSRSQTASIGYRHFLFRDPNSELSLGLTLDLRESQTFLLDDIPFSFSVGPENGRSAVSVLRVSQAWSERTTNRVLDARSQFNFGLGIFGATVNDSGTDGRFFSWQGQFQWVQALGKDFISIVRLGTQLTDNSLLPLEQFGIGGSETVRGYRQNLGVGDSGVLGTVEFRIPLLRDRALGLVQIAPFFDIGRVWSSRNSDIPPSTLSSAGIGLHWNPHPNVRVKLEWATPLTSVNNLGSGTQTQSLNFLLQVTGF
ncbi:ShlB/FhaC/HecB family hemolysin secretion/activation protein [Tumidithrix helvetica PCC 7403]|uniref:ShlB/FhaC/HecB family hemolysin secretion/activation protein n=1 Tax=Tumidithrix helvetica TaxID=3457545 RepID=UPI003C81943F